MLNCLLLRGFLKKNKKNKGKQQKSEGTEKKKKDNNNLTIVLKVDLHCEECISKVLKCIRSCNGVENASIEDNGQRITVVGKVDPVKLRERLEKKTHNKIEILSPLLNKDHNNKKDFGKQEKKKKEKEKSDGKKQKEKELPLTTAVLKIQLHCKGCIKKIYKLIVKSKGYQEMKIDKHKELVTVTGTMDMNVLVNLLKKHLKTSIEILPPKKEIEKKDKINGGQKGKVVVGSDKGKTVVGSGDNNKKSISGKAVGDEDGGKMGIKGDKVIVEGNKSEFQSGYSHPMLYGSGGVMAEQFHYNVHAPQMFSDENPNACSVM